MTHAISTFDTNLLPRVVPGSALKGAPVPRLERSPRDVRLNEENVLLAIPVVYFVDNRMDLRRKVAVGYGRPRETFVLQIYTRWGGSILRHPKF